jgi:phospholipid transport system transporter-binding protein
MIIQNGKHFSLQGPLTMATVRQLLEQGEELFKPGEVTVDCAAVTEVDSAAVSLMLNWLREADKRKQRFVFSNLPENLKSLAAVYGVLDLIPRA